MKDATERLTIWIDPSIKYHAKIKALQNRTTLSKVVEDLLYSYLGSKKEAKEYARQLHDGKSK